MAAASRWRSLSSSPSSRALGSGLGDGRSASSSPCGSAAAWGLRRRGPQLSSAGAGEPRRGRRDGVGGKGDAAAFVARGLGGGDEPSSLAVMPRDGVVVGRVDSSRVWGVQRREGGGDSRARYNGVTREREAIRGTRSEGLLLVSSSALGLFRGQGESRARAGRYGIGVEESARAWAFESVRDASTPAGFPGGDEAGRSSADASSTVNWAQLLGSGRA
jgi:hypothetical protein